MHLIVCVDDRYGMSFCGRRLSRDTAVIRHILEMTAGCKLWMLPYSQLLFPADSVWADMDFLAKAKPGEYCFAEVLAAVPSKEKLESVILYRWNRAYPSTEKFPRKLLDGSRLICKEDFPGNSHDMITMERYAL